MNKIISSLLIILISNYAFSCYSSQQMSAEDGWVKSNEKIISFMDKNNIEVRFYKNTGRYIPDEKVITGITIRYGQGIGQQKGVIYKRGTSKQEGLQIRVSLDDVMWVKVERFDGLKTIATIILVPAAIIGLLLVGCMLSDCFEFELSSK